MFSTYGIMESNRMKQNNVSFTNSCLQLTSGDLMMFMSWMVKRIAEDD